MSESTPGPKARPSGSDRYRHNPRVAQQVLGGKAVILNYEGRRILGLNGTGTRIWEQLDGRATLDEIAARAAAACGVPCERATDDVRAFVADLLRRDLVVRCEENT